MPGRIQDQGTEAYIREVGESDAGGSRLLALAFGLDASNVAADSLASGLMPSSQ